jgi:hypothetical protein
MGGYEQNTRPSLWLEFDLAAWVDGVDDVPSDDLDLDALADLTEWAEEVDDLE